MKYKKIMIALAATAALSAAGCGSSSKDTVEVTPTPVPTAAPTSTPATASPLPTSTPAPKLIGVKTSTAKFVYLSNSTKGEVREIYLRAAGGSEWGKNLVPAESTIKAAEQVQMYYTPESATDAIYDMKIVDGDGNAYEIYSVELGDMESAKLMIDNGSAYLTYMSLSEKSEKSTQEMWKRITVRIQTAQILQTVQRILLMQPILLLTAAQITVITAVITITVIMEVTTAETMEVMTAVITEIMTMVTVMTAMIIMTMETAAIPITAMMAVM